LPIKIFEESPQQSKAAYNDNIFYQSSIMVTIDQVKEKLCKQVSVCNYSCGTLENDSPEQYNFKKNWTLIPLQMLLVNRMTVYCI